MKIGILTYHYAYNYGAVLQAYALQSFLQDNGHAVEFVNYQNNQVNLYYDYFGWKVFPKRGLLKLTRAITVCLSRVIKFRKFKRCTSNLLNITKRIYRIDDPILNIYDLIIVGSDQMWNKKITGCFDKFYWGEFVRYTQKPAITYAICMNADSVSSDDIQHIKLNLDNFTRLSARESSLADFIKTISGRDVEVSLDPTLMVDSSIWLNMLKQPQGHSKKPYVCVYPVLEREAVIERAKEFAKKKDLKLVVLYPLSESMPFKGYHVASTPVEFLNIIAHADYVITSSFHGLAFSIIFNREVYVFGDSGKNTRMKSLLDSLGMGDRFMDNEIIEERSQLDYNSISLKMKSYRINSQKYLLDSINII